MIKESTSCASYLMVMTSLSRLNLSVTLLRLEICWSCLSITRLISLISRLKIMFSFLLQCNICDSLEIRHGLLQVGPPGQGGQGPGVGLHIIGAEQQQRGEIEAQHVL